MFVLYQRVSTVVGAHRRDWAGLGGPVHRRTYHQPRGQSHENTGLSGALAGVRAEGLSPHLGDSPILTCDDTREYHLLMSRTSLFQVLLQHSSVSGGVSLPVIIRANQKLESGKTRLSCPPCPVSSRSHRGCSAGVCGVQVFLHTRNPSPSVLSFHK